MDLYRNNSTSFYKDRFSGHFYYDFLRNLCGLFLGQLASKGNNGGGIVGNNEAFIKLSFHFLRPCKPIRCLSSAEALYIRKSASARLWAFLHLTQEAVFFVGKHLSAGGGCGDTGDLALLRSYGLLVHRRDDAGRVWQQPALYDVCALIWPVGILCGCTGGRYPGRRHYAAACAGAPTHLRPGTLAIPGRRDVAGAVCVRWRHAASSGGDQSPRRPVAGAVLRAESAQLA
ncbi:MAG: hypothetical protein HC912_11925, partial [Saprospiraceae bacterium]|nr:hypothetical protein [Saprospiraceae bacterium]